MKKKLSLEHVNQSGLMLRTFKCTCGETTQWYRKKVTQAQAQTTTDNRQWCWKCKQITEHVETTFSTPQQ